ncbi:hypothetical protein [Bradyrhizobium canariense]|uniref:hypothetical protein n=1 Tax=Bradyrhizobium canariense TaxID=255045 RepID=UPI0011BABCF6|nr:hypothetical protein [Bradyrhizobium canariense]
MRVTRKADQVSGQLPQGLVIALGPSILDRDVLCLGESIVAQTVAKCGQVFVAADRRADTEKPDAGIGDCCANAASGLVAAMLPRKVTKPRRRMALPEEAHQSMAAT